jgi:ADP-heptose:LPS heptosyltransferase
MTASLQSPINPPIRLLVIQMGDTTDVVQSLMALKAAKQLYPELKIDFLCHSRHSDSAKRVTWIQKVFALPTEEWTKPIQSGEKSESEILKQVAKWTNQMIDQRWDIIANWSYSSASSFLTALLPGRYKLGVSRGKDGTIAYCDEWSVYIDGVINGGFIQNIHRIDILTTQLLTTLQIQFHKPTQGENETITSRGFFNLDYQAILPTVREIDLTRKWIMVDLSENSNHSISLADWKSFLLTTLEKQVDYYIGVVGTSDLVLTLKSTMPTHPRLQFHTDVVGFDPVCYWLSRAQWVITASLPTVQIASVLGTRILYLCESQKDLYQFGPYGTGHYVILKPNKVQLDAVWRYASTEWTHMRRITVSEYINSDTNTEINLDAFRTKIRPVDEGGGVLYEPLLKKHMSYEDWCANVLGQVARYWYCGWVAPIGQEIEAYHLNPFLLQEIRKSDETTKAFLKICRELVKHTLRLSNRASKLKSENVMSISDKMEITAMGKEILEMEELLDRLGRTTYPLESFCRISKILMHNIEEEKLSGLSRQTAAHYKKMADGIKLFRDWLKHTLQLAKPRQVDVQPTLF